MARILQHARDRTSLLQPRRTGDVGETLVCADAFAASSKPLSET
jgi:hypothetical protein